MMISSSCLYCLPPFMLPQGTFAAVKMSPTVRTRIAWWIWQTQLFTSTHPEHHIWVCKSFCGGPTWSQLFDFIDIFTLEVVKLMLRDQIFQWCHYGICCKRLPNLISILPGIKPFEQDRLLTGLDLQQTLRDFAISRFAACKPEDIGVVYAVLGVQRATKSIDHQVAEHICKSSEHIILFKGFVAWSHQSMWAANWPICNLSTEMSLCTL